MKNKIVQMSCLWAFVLPILSVNVFAQDLYSFKISIEQTGPIAETITIEDTNAVSTGIVEGTFTFSELLSNAYSGYGHAMSEAMQFPDVSFELQLPEGFETLGCSISFVDNSPSPLYVYKRDDRLTMSFSQGYSAFHGDYKVLCY
ncbi:hypothetical protein [uncultured Vibrio sp.]|uniref:hypothetical protein n=1 Tax=uncultured Vibrio sp. TaxID=114054 RepID=UPI0025E19798|nr:hypothetical protein [uncultured Vibrio sp.]